MEYHGIGNASLWYFHHISMEFHGIFPSFSPTSAQAWLCRTNAGDRAVFDGVANGAGLAELGGAAVEGHGSIEIFDVTIYKSLYSIDGIPIYDDLCTLIPYIHIKCIFTIDSDMSHSF